jgi:hypothetical protein
LLTRGFLTRHWRIALAKDFSKKGDPALFSATTPPCDLTPILAGLIKVMWTALSKLWIDHLATIHQTQHTTQSPITRQDLSNRVRRLHALKDRTLPGHAHYFHDDVDAFIAKAGIFSLQSYINHYTPIINASIQDSRNLPPTVARRAAVSISHHAMEEPTHRKRNRRRLLMAIVQTIRSWTNYRSTRSQPR